MIKATGSYTNVPSISPYVAEIFQPTLPPPSLSSLFSLLLLLAGAPVAILYRISFSLLFVSLLCSLMHVQLSLYRLSVDPAASRSHAAVCSERYAISDRNEFRACRATVYNAQAIIFKIIFFDIFSSRKDERMKTGSMKQAILFVTQEKNQSSRYGSRLKMIIVEQCQR